MPKKSFTWNYFVLFMFLVCSYVSSSWSADHDRDPLGSCPARATSPLTADDLTDLVDLKVEKRHLFRAALTAVDDLYLKLEGRLNAQVAKINGKLEQQRKHYCEQLDKAQEELREAKALYEDLQRKSQAELQELKSSSEVLQRNEDALRQKLETLQREKADLEAKADALERERASFAPRIKDLEETLQKKTSEMEEERDREIIELKSSIIYVFRNLTPNLVELMRDAGSMSEEERQRKLAAVLKGGSRVSDILKMMCGGGIRGSAVDTINRFDSLFPGLKQVGADHYSTRTYVDKEESPSPAKSINPLLKVLTTPSKGEGATEEGEAVRKLVLSPDA